MPKKFNSENKTIPCVVPDALKGLTQCEEMLIARAFPVMQVYVKPRYGTVGYKGHCVTLPHNVQNVANILPNIVADIPVIIFTAKGCNNEDVNFKVRRERVFQALVWLKNNNPYYRNIIIDEQRVADLPVDNIIKVDKELDLEASETLPDTGPTDDNEFNQQILTSSFIPNSQKQPLEYDRLTNAIRQQHNMDISPNPYNEFATPRLATLAFPTLFPDGNGDPTNPALVRQLSDSETESFSMHLKRLIKFGEQENDRWIYRFATHPRFGYWAYNMLYR